jgi:hypothetical protein
MNIACPHCRHEQDVPEPKLSQGVQCPACFKVFVPLSNSSPTPPPAPPPPSLPPIFQEYYTPLSKDMEHLRLLRIFYFVAGGLAGFGSCFGLIYVALGIAFVSNPHLFPDQGQGSPPFMGWIFLALGLLIFFVGWTVATMKLFVGKFLGQRKHYTFCFVVAAISCIFVPTGTVLGVFTIVVLSRQSVKQLFNGKQNSIERGA